MIYITLIFSSLFFKKFLKIMTSDYLSKYFNFISVYNGFSVILAVPSAYIVMHPNILK